MIKLEQKKYYHIYNRGNNREKLFYTKGNYQYFLTNYRKHCFHILETYAYCLMNNHFHMLVSVRPLEKQRELFEQTDLRSKQLRSPSRHLGNFFNSYTLSINKQEDRIGSLFQRPFRRKEIETEKYFCRLLVYIHQNPVKHGFVTSIEDYPYSSFHAYNNEGESFLNKNKALALFGGFKNFLEAHKELVKIDTESEHEP